MTFQCECCPRTADQYSRYVIHLQMSHSLGELARAVEPSIFGGIVLESELRDYGLHALTPPPTRPRVWDRWDCGGRSGKAHHVEDALPRPPVDIVARERDERQWWSNRGEVHMRQTAWHLLWEHEHSPKPIEKRMEPPKPRGHYTIPRGGWSYWHGHQHRGCAVCTVIFGQPI